MTFGGGEIIVLLSNALWTLYSIKAQAWFERASQLHRAYVASLSAMGWLMLGQRRADRRSAWRARRSRCTTAGCGPSSSVVAILASGLGSYCWNIGAARLGVAVASLWVNLVPFFAVLWSMTYGFMPNAYQIVGGLVALSGVVYMQWRKLTVTQTRMTVPALKARNCRWIAVPGAADQRGSVNFLELGKGLDFQPKRLFWLHHVAAGQWRGRHGHRETQLVLVAVNGVCRVHLDDGAVKETVTLDDPARALYIGDLGVARADRFRARHRRRGARLDAL